MMKLIVQGRVVRGEGMASRLGCPTANIAIEEGTLIPAFGIYVGEAELETVWYPALICVSDGHTGLQLKIEVHFLDVTIALVDKRLRVFFYQKLREIIDFPGEKEMARLIQQDLLQAREWFLHNFPEHIRPCPPSGL